MLRRASTSLRQRTIAVAGNASSSSVRSATFLILTLESLLHGQRTEQKNTSFITHFSGTASSPSLSIWRRKKEMGKEGLIIVKELKRLKPDPIRFDRFMRTHVSRLLKSDLVAVLAEFQRQNQVSLSMKVVFNTYQICQMATPKRPRGMFGKTSWKSTASGSENVMKGVRFRPGDGSSISFWHDVWVMDLQYPFGTTFGWEKGHLETCTQKSML